MLSLCDILDGHISLHIDVFVTYFCQVISDGMLYLLHIYHVSFIYFSGVQESIICIVHGNQILSDVKYSDHIVASTGMAIRIQNPTAVLRFHFYITL